MATDTQAQTQALRGFLAHPEAAKAPNQTKALVLESIVLGQGAFWSGEIARQTELSRGQVVGCLQRLLRYDYAERTVAEVPFYPHNSAFLYRISPRGIAWLRWARDEALIGVLEEELAESQSQYGDYYPKGR